MLTATGSLLLASLLYLALPATARAQGQLLATPIGDAPPTELPDTIFRSVADRPVMVQLTDGRELAVRILAIEPKTLVVSLSASGQVRTLPRATVTTVRLLAPALVNLDQTQEVRCPPVPPLRKRHMALNLSIAPGVDLDLDAGLFHGFANTGIVLALGTEGAIVPFSLGLGVGIPWSHSLPALKIDVFAHLSVVWDVFGNYSDFGPGRGNSAGFGVGFGIHYTWSNGFTLGITVPLVGYSVILGDTSLSGRLDVTEAIGYYFLTSSESLPLGYLGYRF